MSVLVRPDGCRLYYERHGPADGPPLLLLEGSGGDIPGWRRNLPNLAAVCRVIAHDFRGNGRSDPPDGPTPMLTFVEDTAALLDELGLPDAHVYGQSFGGMVAIELGLRHPGRVRSLVLAATHAGPGRSVRPGRESSVPKDRPHLALYSGAFVREHPEEVAENLRVGSERPQSMAARRRQWEAIQGWDAWDRLGAISRPTLVLHGTADRLVPVENGRRLAAAIPGAELRLLEGAGHAYHAERPAESDGAVLAFVGRVEAAR